MLICLHDVYCPSEHSTINQNQTVCRRMSDIAEGIASTEAAEGRHSYNFKWCPETELAFLKAVYANKAFYRTSEKFEVKWTRVIGDCSNRTSFKEQKFQLKQGSLQMKLKSLYSSYLNEFGNRNKSALPDQDDLSEMNSLLCEMLAKIQKIGEDAELEKKTKTQKKKAISDITSIVQKGGASVKKELAQLAENMRSGDEVMLSSSMTNYSKSFTPTPKAAPAIVTAEPLKRKRIQKHSDDDDIQLMNSFGVLIKKDAENAEARLQSLENRILESSESSTAALREVSRDSALMNAALISAISSLTNSIQKHF
jgi:hypothetical protein